MNLTHSKNIFVLIVFSLSLISSAVYSQEKYKDAQDSMTTLSLWFESHKTKDFESSLKYSWKINKIDPKFVRYKFYSKFEEMLTDAHDKAEDEEVKLGIADTLLYVYDEAIKYDHKKSNYFRIKKAFVLETWYEKDPAEVIEAYESAIEANPNTDPYYRNRLGALYAANLDKNEDYLIRAISLYSKLAEEEPDNPAWLKYIENLADDPEKLIEVIKKSWDLDKDNLEKAWKYASTTLQYNEYELALEPLEFLIQKSPNVINYWKKLASVYDKLNNTSKAIDANKKLIQLEPSNKDNYFNLAIIYFKKLNQPSVARSYLKKASNVSPSWDYPLYVEAQLYEQAARECTNSTLEFMDKCVYQLAIDTYIRAARKNGPKKIEASERAKALKAVAPSQENYFFKQLESGVVIKIEGKCYGWIGRSIIVP